MDVFTDTDLKILKEWVEYETFLSSDIKDIRRLLPGFIKRFEAAEAFIDVCDDEHKWGIQWEAWLRSAGKEGQGE